jgi:hypothetical protein
MTVTLPFTAVRTSQLTPLALEITYIVLAGRFHFLRAVQLTAK